MFTPLQTGSSGANGSGIDHSEAGGREAAGVAGSDDEIV